MPKKRQNVQKTRFFSKKLRGVNGLKKEAILLAEGGQGHGVRAKGVGVNSGLVS